MSATASSPGGSTHIWSMKKGGSLRQAKEGGVASWALNEGLVAMEAAALAAASTTALSTIGSAASAARMKGDAPPSRPKRVTEYDAGLTAAAASIVAAKAAARSISSACGAGDDDDDGEGRRELAAVEAAAVMATAAGAETRRQRQRTGDGKEHILRTYLPRRLIIVCNPARRTLTSNGMTDTPAASPLSPTARMPLVCGAAVVGYPPPSPR
mmetsp:Transcript_17864/g.36593  ORF Transcript_17864/g.36593 Transcript_17864/m.36593 type:complete len:212 (-) Transcript_17864:665-1300(-)